MKNKMNMKNYLIFLLGIILLPCGLFTACEKIEYSVLTNYDFQEVKKIAKYHNSLFCVVLIDSTSHATKMYMDALQNNEELTQNTLFNLVDISHSKNTWYEQWLCPISLPVTCVFSSSGELIDYINGASYESFEYLKHSILKKESNVKHDIPNNFKLKKKELIHALNIALKCKEGLNNNIDIRDDLSQSLKLVKYPFNLGLQLINEKRLNQLDLAKETSKLLLTYKEKSTILVYSEQFYNAESTLNPAYNKETAPHLQIMSDTIDLKTCKLNQTYNIYLDIKNEGYFPLTIFDVVTGCSCLKYVDDKNKILKGSEISRLSFEFTPDVIGVVERNAFIISDALDLSLPEMTVMASVE